MLKRVNFSPILVLMLCIGIPMWALASTTGKISGSVVDADSGEPLPGVNVVIQGTTMGAATDVDGNYFILNIRPGSYTLNATMMGYESQRQESVVVNIDRTSTIDFILKSTVLEVGEVVTIVAERPKIQEDVSFTQHTMNAEEVYAIPTTPDLREAIAVRAGIGRNVVGMVTIREGNYDEVGLYVDGFNSNDARQGNPEFNVGKTEIQEVQILKGGFNAEYGKVRSGIVNIITREGGSVYSFRVDGRLRPAAKKHFGPAVYSPENYWHVGRFLSLDPTGDRDGDGNPDFEGWRQFLADAGGEITYSEPGFDPQTITSAEQALEIWKHQHPQWEYGDKPDYNVEATLSGPVPFTRGKTTFSLSGFYDKAYYFIPFVVPNHLDSRVNLRLLHKLSSNITLRAHGNFSEFKGIASGEANSGEGFSARTVFADPRSFANAHVLSQQQLHFVGNGTLSYAHQSSMTKTDLKTWNFGVGLTHVLNPASFYEVKAQFNRTYSWSGPGRFADLTTVVNTVDGFQLNELPNGFYGIPTSDIAGLYRMGEDNGRRDNSVYETYFIDVDYTNQINHSNQIKMGAGLTLSHQELDYGIDLLRNQDGLRYLRWIYNDIRYQEAELFVQDKIEFQGMVMNVGVRLDYFKTDAPNFTDRFSKYYTQSYNYSNPHLAEIGIEGGEGEGIYGAPSEDADNKIALSPRLGIAHPISENSKFFFNYGYFYQRGEIYDLTNNYLRRRNRATTLSNADLDFRKTIAYEAGVEQNIAGVFDITLSGYYRDVTRDIRYVSYQGDYEGNTIGYNRPENTGYADIRGIELNADFHYGQYVRGFFNYDYALDSSGLWGYSTIYQDPNRADVRVNANIDEAKARPRLKTNIKFIYPRYDGESVLGKILSGASLSTYFWWRSGVWLTYHSDNYPGIEDNNVHWKSTYNLDLELTKLIPLSSGLEAEVYLQVKNALNSKFLNHESSSAWRSGGALNPTNRNVYLDMCAEEGVTQGTYEGSEAIEKYLDRGLYWDQFNQPRDFWVGLRFNFH